MSHALPLANTFFTRSILFHQQIRCAEPEDTLHPHEGMEGFLGAGASCLPWPAVPDRIAVQAAHAGLLVLRSLMSFAIFPQTMSCDRFDALASALPFAHNEADHPADDRLWRHRPLLRVLETCMRRFRPSASQRRPFQVAHRKWHWFITINPTSI